jgi:cytochrome c oxidase cbb3-type subunit 4
VSYDAARHFADSWGLVFMGATFVVLIGWALRPKAKSLHDDAANMIFDKDDDNG